MFVASSSRRELQRLDSFATAYIRTSLFAVPHRFLRSDFAQNPGSVRTQSRDPPEPAVEKKRWRGTPRRRAVHDLPLRRRSGGKWDARHPAPGDFRSNENGFHARRATRAVERPPRPKKLRPVGLGIGRIRLITFASRGSLGRDELRTPIPPAGPDDPDHPLLGETECM